MKTILIPKKSGGHRRIYVQSPVEKSYYRWLGWRLQSILERIPESRVIHGFFPGRSPVTNALAHCGKRYTLTLDIADFFDSVTPEQINLSSPHPEYGKWACKDGAPRQGLSSSPAAANLAAVVLDRMILQDIARLFHAEVVVYTRYADDLTFSSDSLRVLQIIAQHARISVETMGWKINPKKTRIQNADYGRRVICGISVGGPGDIRVPRSFRRKLRAALHQHPRSNKTRGMVEWAKLKPPASVPRGELGHWARSGIVAVAKQAFKK